MNPIAESSRRQTPAVQLGLCLVFGMVTALFCARTDSTGSPRDLFPASRTYLLLPSPFPVRNSEEPDQTDHRLLFLLSTLLLGTTGAAVFYGKKQKRLEGQLHRQAPINPHFIANSLNAIECLIQTGQQKEASRYFAHFSQLSRRFSHTSYGNPIRLTEDLEILRHFLALTHLRFRNIECHIHLELQVPAEQVIVPAMLLQSYIEEAIWLRLKPRKEPGRLDVTIRNTTRHLCFQLEDNGLDRESAQQLQARRTAIPQERLHPISRVAGVEVAENNLTGPDGRLTGVRVDIQLPLRQRL